MDLIVMTVVVAFKQELRDQPQMGVIMIMRPTVPLPIE